MGFMRKATLSTLVLLLLVGACAAAFADSHSVHRRAAPGSERVFVTAEDLGVEVVALRPTAADRMLELRVRVIDPDKAFPLVGRSATKERVYLVAAKTDKVLPVPETKVGTLRQRSVRPEAGKTYFLMFYNPGVVNPGDEVTLAVGERRLRGLFVASKTQVGPATKPAAPTAAPDTEDPPSLR